MRVKKLNEPEWLEYNIMYGFQEIFALVEQEKVQIFIDNS
jgi:hypothetical protein